jgi:hypothetical protein
LKVIYNCVIFEYFLEMGYCKKFIVSLLPLLFFTVATVQAQRQPTCDIPVKTEVVSPDGNRGNGELLLDFGSGDIPNHFKVFMAKPEDGTPWKKVERARLTGLEAGFYDFLIVDTSRKECTRQLTVEIKPK